MRMLDSTHRSLCACLRQLGSTSEAYECEIQRFGFFSVFHFYFCYLLLLSPLCIHLSYRRAGTRSFFSCISPAKHEINRLHWHCARSRARSHSQPISSNIFFFFFMLCSPQLYSIIPCTIEKVFFLLSFCRAAHWWHRFLARGHCFIIYIFHFFFSFFFFYFVSE